MFHIIFYIIDTQKKKREKGNVTFFHIQYKPGRDPLPPTRPPIGQTTANPSKRRPTSTNHHHLNLPPLPTQNKKKKNQIPETIVA